MSGDVWLEEEYFIWLASECFSEASERRQYEGVLRVLHDIPFYWTLWSDENRAGDALTFRQSDFLSNYTREIEGVDRRWLEAWAQATPSTLEVLLGIARRWHYYFEGSVPFYFAHLFLNLELDRFPGKRLPRPSVEVVRATLDDWMSRQFHPTGEGSPFPLRHADQDVDLRRVDIWGQMNAYSLEHFQ